LIPAEVYFVNIMNLVKFYILHDGLFCIELPVVYACHSVTFMLFNTYVALPGGTIVLSRSHFHACDAYYLCLFYTMFNVINKRNSFIHSFILNIYIAPLQENYSEALPTPARLKEQS